MNFSSIRAFLVVIVPCLLALTGCKSEKKDDEIVLKITYQQPKPDITDSLKNAYPTVSNVDEIKASVVKYCSCNDTKVNVDIALIERKIKLREEAADFENDPELREIQSLLLALEPQWIQCLAEYQEQFADYTRRISELEIDERQNVSKVEQAFIKVYCPRMLVMDSVNKVLIGYDNSGNSF